MLDMTFAVTGCKFRYRGNLYEIICAGIRDEQPYAVIQPDDPRVVDVILKNIFSTSPPSFNIEEIQRDLDCS